MTGERGGRALRILAIHRYYWPDTPPYASMLRAIVQRWANDGHEVEVLSTQPSYKPGAGISRQPPVEELDGVLVRRLTLLTEKNRGTVKRMANMLLFAIGIIVYALRRRRFDIVMASTAPPVLVGAAGRLAARLIGAKFVYHCMDIHPEIGSISGEFSHPLVFSLLRRLDTLTCVTAARVVVLSEDMKKAIRCRPGGGASRIEIINNFDLPTFDKEGRDCVPPQFIKAEGRFRILFAGNIGRFQGLEAVIEAMCLLRHRPDIELVLLGEGTAVEELRYRASDVLDNTVRFFPHQPVSMVRSIIRTADFCLVSLTPGIYRFAFPSKTMTYLAEGKPLLVSVEPESELAALVLREGIGKIVPSQEPAAIAAAIEEAADSRENQQRMAERAAAVGIERFNQAGVLARWSELIDRVAQED